MTTRINLPSGAYADLRAVEDVTERQRRPIRRIQAQLTGNAGFLDAVNEAEKAGGADMTPDAQRAIAQVMGDAFDPLETLNDLLVLAAVVSWSYPFEPSLDSVQDLPGRDLDALRTAVAPYIAALQPNFEPTPDPASPIVPSGE